MPDPQTTNIGLFIPTRGSDVGTWDTPANSNTSVLDTCIGGTATISLNNANVVLSAAQFQSEWLVFNSTLTGNVAITFPTSFTKSYVIQNLCTGTSAFTITLVTTVAGNSVIGCPAGELFEVRNTGGNVFYKNFRHIGEYWDYAGSSVPNWISACTVAPYLNCDGTGFSSAAFPVLTQILGGTTLPDFRGRSALYLNQGSNRVTSSQGGVDGNTVAAGGGAQTTTLLSSNLPHSIPYTDPTHSHSTNVTTNSANTNNPNGAQPGGGGATPSVYQNPGASNGNFAANFIVNSGVGITVNPSSLGTDQFFSNLHPVTVSGLRLIRAG